jgi:hypothetical protein
MGDKFQSTNIKKQKQEQISSIFKLKAKIVV